MACSAVTNFRAFALALGACLLGAAPAHADPIFTPIFVALIAATGIPATIAGVSTAALLSAVVVTAIGIGLTYILSPKPPPPENGLIAFQQTVPPIIFGYGIARCAGAVMLLETDGGLLNHIAAVAGHKVHSFDSFYLNSDHVVLSGTGVVQPGADGRYSDGYVTIDNRLGNNPEVCYAQVTAALPYLWTSAFLGDGTASLLMQCGAASAKQYPIVYPYGRPTPSAVIYYREVFDPRDSTQDPTNPATFKYSANAALCILHHRCFCPYGPLKPYAEAIAPVVAAWIQAADDCDVLVANKVGNEARYQLGGWTTTQSDDRAALQPMLAACDGFHVVHGDGTETLVVGVYRPPTVTLTDDDIRGFQIQTNVASTDKINQATATWTAPECDYTTVETDPRIDTADQLLRGPPPRTAQLALPWVQRNGHASRLLKREMFRQEQTVRGKLYLALSGLNAMYERWILINSNTIPQLNGLVIENRRANFSLTSGTFVELEFIASGSGIDAYDPTTDESTPPTVPQAAVTITFPTPANVTVVAETSDGVTVYLDVSWDVPLYNGLPWTSLTYAVQYRLSDAGGGVPGQWIQQYFDSPTIVGTRVEVSTGTVPGATLLDVQVASVSTKATLSTWSPTVQVSTVLLGVAPGVPTNLVAKGATGDAALSCTNPNSSVFSAARFYRGAHGAAFSTAVDISGAIYGTANGTSTWTDTYTAGTYDYWATAENSSGVKSAPAGPATATIS